MAVDIGVLVRGGGNGGCADMSVFSLHGVHTKDEVSKEVVAKLEVLLEEARRGEVLGFAYAILTPQNNAGIGWTCAPEDKTLALPVMTLHASYSSYIAEVVRE